MPTARYIYSSTYEINIDKQKCGYIQTCISQFNVPFLTLENNMKNDLNPTGNVLFIYIKGFFVGNINILRIISSVKRIIN